MTVAVEQKCLLVSGGISSQPGWFINLLSWFGPAYDTQKFISRARMVLGDENKDTKAMPMGKRKGKR